MTRILLGAALVLGLAATAQARGDIDAGRTKSQACVACHGPDGNGVGDPQYPIIAGQHADYLARTLRDYRSGARPNPIMAGFASTLSDRDIEDLSAFFAAQEGRLRDMRGTR